MNKTRWIAALSLVGIMLASGAQANADFYLHNTLDLSNSNYFPTPLFDNASGNGTSPSAVTTDGTDIWLAGFNGGTASDTGIVKISDPWGTPSATQLVSLPTPASRGYSGLAYDYSTGTVLAAYDDGSADPMGITGWNPATGANTWAVNARGGSGVGDDPGFGGVDSGAGWTTFGSGRRALIDSSTGAEVYTTGTGMIINGAGTGTFWRDQDYAPNGDIWLREGNQVISATRTGGNSVMTAVQKAFLTDADFVGGQNIAYMDGAPGGDLVIFNDRNATGLGQLFANVVKMINPDGTPATAQLLDGAGAPLDILFGLGSGYFDFEWDAANQALLVSDYNNRMVYRFLTMPVPEPASFALLAIGGVAILRRRR